MAPAEDNPEQFVLYFELVEGRKADAIVAAEALIAWVEAIKEANAFLSPLSELTVELVGTETGSLGLPTLLKFIDDKLLGGPARTLDQYPYIKKLVRATVVGIPAAVIGGGIVLGIEMAATEDAASTKVQQEANEDQRQLEQAPSVQAKVREFYRIVERDPAIKKVAVKRNVRGPSLIEVPRERFHQMSGLWKPQEDPPEERPRTEVWDVIVTHPVSLGLPRSWGFMRDGLPFRAVMRDEAFLAAIKDGTLPIVIREGVMMQVVVEYRERLEGEVWVPIPRTWSIKRVLYPRLDNASAAAIPLFDQPQ